MSQLDRYIDRLKADKFTPDGAQLQGLEALSALHEQLCATPSPSAAPSGLRRFLRRGREQQAPAPRGLYLWGGVGRGKTHLADLFFEQLPFPQKLRLHFHRFMRNVHEERAKLGHISDPLDLIARHFAARARVLCLDEMQVTDITDAMLIHGLLAGLFKRGVTLITTSNLAPDELYRDGLQRARFLPAIELLKQRTQVLQLDGGIDYRLRTLRRAEIYHTPLDEMARFNLQLNFDRLAGRLPQNGEPLTINGRDIPVQRCGDGVAWFDFKALCEGPRAKDDYIEISRYFHTVLLGGIRITDDRDNDVARRFVNLIDVLYDHGVKLVASAQTEPEHLYEGKRLKFEFERTASRLHEMRSEAYLARQHLLD